MVLPSFRSSVNNCTGSSDSKALHFGQPSNSPACNMPTTTRGRADAGMVLLRRSLNRYCRLRTLLFLILFFCTTLSVVVRYVDKKKWCRFHFCYDESWEKPNSENFVCLPKNENKNQEVNLLFGLSGNHPGVLAEFEVALKSVLMNCPMRGSLDIHIMVDDEGEEAFKELSQRVGLFDKKEWWSPVKFMVYNVQDKISEWTKRFNPQIQKLFHYRHTFGSCFRLFAHEVLPPTVKHVLYADSDVVIMANLAGLWQYLDKDVVFQWGKGRCAGFIFLNLERMPEIWQLMDQVDWHDYPSKNLDDQKLLRGVERLQPNITGCIPQAWDFSFADSDGWNIKGDLYKKRPQVGMAHFNGVGGTSKRSIYEELPLFKKYPDSWGIFLHYVKLPWDWVWFAGESTIPGSGNTIEFVKVDTKQSN